jgi:ribosomal protein S18 acetylase RimI-like enzyme
MSEQWSIRRAIFDDAAALAALKLKTFRETFVDGVMDMGYSPENLAIFEARSYGVDNVSAELSDPKRAQWVAEAGDGARAGYVHVGPCKLPHPEAGPEQGELYQIYIAERWQRHGLGRDLLNVAFDWLGENMPGPIWLGVFSGNIKAQDVYAARGFVKVGEYEFMVGDHRDHEFIMRRG